MTRKPIKRIASSLSKVGLILVAISIGFILLAFFYALSSEGLGTIIAPGLILTYYAIPIGLIGIILVLISVFRKVGLW